MASKSATTRRKNDGEEAMQKRAKLSVSVDLETYRRLVIHACYAGMTQGDYLQQLIDTHCRDYRVQANPPRGRMPVESVDRPEIAGSVMENAA